MAVLNAWQKLTRVLPGQPFGSGIDGSYSFATIPTPKPKTCSGTATSTTLTADTDTDPYVVGDIVAIFQSRGTGVGQWEVNKITVVGSDQYTLQEPLNYTYTDSGASQAQVVKIPQYTNVTVESGTWTTPDWDGNINGILTLASKTGITVTGTVVGTAKGFVRGTGSSTDNVAANQGEGSTATGSSSTSANGNGGGGGKDPAGAGGQESGGGGGGNGTAGSNGTNTSPGTGGSVSGSADLTAMTFGGGGGGGGEGGGESPNQHGGDGGGIIVLFTKSITVAGGIANNGDNAVSSSERSGGGGGAGGSILIVCQTASLGTNLVTASAGNGESGTSGNGGNGGVGRIAVHHSGTVTGTTSPTFTDVTDGSLVESTASFMFFGY